jgi:hypothetical protein
MNDRTVVSRTVAGVAAWGAAVTIASKSGALARLVPATVAPLIVAGIAIPSAAYYRSPSLKRIAARIGPHRLTTLHAWRIVAGIAFLRWGASGRLPKVFTNRAGYGDIAAGVLAIATVALPKNRAAQIAVNAFGAADLALAITTGLRLVLRKEPAMRNIASFPVALIPLFGVGLTGCAHVIAFDLLRKSSPNGGMQ